jgi:hypothetical protein
MPLMQKRRNMTPEQRGRSALKKVVGGALTAGYLVGWSWRGVVDRRASSLARSRRSGG